MDLGAICYIYNDKSRFTNFKLIIKDNELYTNKSVIFIKGFNTILVIVTILKLK